MGYMKKWELYIFELVILIWKKYWGLGIGIICMGELIKYVKSSEYLKFIYLEVVLENKCVINLYKKFGFIEVGEILVLM